ncbi:MAG: hypothetical protein NUV68_08225 [Caldiserica bacterium]|jgi:hypothetical protein|nr:hypothetical protein [Caldisericota bacterium]
MERKKILFSFVGKQDPISQKNGEEGSILTLVRYLKPDRLYLFPSGRGPSGSENEAENTETNAEQLKKQIEENPESFNPGLKVKIIPIFFKDPTDYQEILEKTRESIRTILENSIPENLEIHLNCSSGTPQQKSAWLIFAASRFFDSTYKIWQVVEPRFQHEGNRVKEIKIDFLEEEISFQRMVKLFKNNLFLSAKEEAESLSRLTTNWERRNKIRILARLFEAYHLWDAIRYQEAWKKLNHIYAEIKNIPDFCELETFIKNQIAELERISETPRENPSNLRDLYFNASRCFQKGEYADTLARFWRLYEGLLYYRLRKFEIEPNDVQNSPGEKKDLVVNYLQKCNSKPDSTLKINRAQAPGVLTEVLNDSLLKELLEERIPPEIGKPNKLKEIIEEMIQKRNKSIVAHGMNPVREQEAEKAIKVARYLMEKLAPEINLEESFLPQNLPESILRILHF